MGEGDVSPPPSIPRTPHRPENISTTGGFHHIERPLSSAHSLPNGTNGASRRLSTAHSAATANGANGTANGTANVTANNSRLSVDEQTVNNSTYEGSEPIDHVLSQRMATHSLGTTGRRNSWDLDDYFTGPMDPAKHSKFPFFLRLHGSILPKLILPILFIAGWSCAIVAISKYVHKLAVDSVLLTVLGFVVALALSFRSTTAYERYNEGRKYWALLTLHGRQLAHLIWIHRKEREGPLEKEDILGKLSAINLILAFAQSCKHRLRHEIEYDYIDLKPLIDPLDTFAKAAHDSDPPAESHNRIRAENGAKRVTWGEFLGISFLQTNPRKVYKVAAKQGKQHGNLPYEIMAYMGQYIKNSMDEGCFESAIMQGQVYNAFNNLMDAYGGCDRVLQTPLPLAYNIAISQITWLYVLVLPFQLFSKLGWVAVPGTVVAAYIILGLAAIGREIEDPFGDDVNDLDLDRYCQSLQYDLNVMTSRPGSNKPKSWMESDLNKPLWPYSVSGYNSWKNRSVQEIRQALRGKVSHQASVVREQVFASGEREEGGKKEGVKGGGMMG